MVEQVSQFRGIDLANVSYDLAARLDALKYQLEAIENGRADDDASHNAARVIEGIKNTLTTLGSGLADCSVSTSHPGAVQELRRVLGTKA